MVCVGFVFVLELRLPQYAHHKTVLISCWMLVYEFMIHSEVRQSFWKNPIVVFTHLLNDLITIFKVDLICYFLDASSFMVLKPSKLVLQKEKENV